MMKIVLLRDNFGLMVNSKVDLLLSYVVAVFNVDRFVQTELFQYRDVNATLVSSEQGITGCRGKGEDKSMLLLLPQATHSIYITRTSNVKPAKTVERKNAD